MTFLDRFLGRSSEDVLRLYRDAVNRQSGYDGLFGAHCDDYVRREEQRKAFGDYWRKRIDDARLYDHNS